MINLKVIGKQKKYNNAIKSDARTSRGLWQPLGVTRKNEMNLWILKVLDSASANWEASTYKGEVIVRASDEISARREASNCFAIATDRNLGEIVKASPWPQAQLVSCEQYSGNEYPIQGEVGVLYPSNT